MIVPQPREDETQQRRIAALTTAGIVVVAAITIAFVAVPDYTTTQDQYRQLDPARLAELRPEPETEPEQESNEESETEEEDNPEEAVEDAEPQNAPERVDLSEFSSEGLDVDLSPNETANQQRTESAESDVSGGNTTLRVERENVGDIGGIETFDDPSESAVPRGRGNQMTTGSGESGIAVAEGSGSGAGASEGEGFGDGSEMIGGSEGRAGNISGSSVEVSLKNLDEFGGDYQNLDIRKLIQWMKNNPAELPIGVKQHVGYEPHHLSSALPIETSDGTQYELYLMCKESLYEIHIVLAQGQQARYLVDRSFKKQSRKFRVGTVRRGEDGTITGVESRAEPLGEESDRFYQIFLSWWNGVKDSVEPQTAE